MAGVSISGTLLTISGVAAGTAQVNVTDQAGNAVLISVTVSPVASVPLGVSPSSASGNVGDTLSFLLSGGTAPYTVTMTNNSIASVTTSGAAFDVLLTNVGTTSATVVDALGQMLIVPVTVEQISTVLRLSPSALLVAVN